MGCDIYFDLHAPVEFSLECYSCGKVIERNQNGCIIGHEGCTEERYGSEDALPCIIDTNGTFR